MPKTINFAARDESRLSSKLESADSSAQDIQMGPSMLRVNAKTKSGLSKHSAASNKVAPGIVEHDDSSDE